MREDCASSVNLLGLTRCVRASTLGQTSIPVVEASLAYLLQSPSLLETEALSKETGDRSLKTS